MQENSRSIYRICLAYLYDRSHADDLYQEIQLQIWKSLDNYRGDAKLSTWVYRVAVNTAISYNTKQKTVEHVALDDAITISDNDKSAVHQQEQDITNLYKAISQLKEQDRLVVSLLLEGLSYKEIADVTGDKHLQYRCPDKQNKRKADQIINP